MQVISVSDTFEFQHSLKGDVFGESQNLHAVQFKVSVEGSQQGIVRDETKIFSIIREKLKKILDPFRGSCFDQSCNANDDWFGTQNTTMENVAMWVSEKFNYQTIPGFAVKKVTIEESPNISCSFCRGRFKVHVSDSVVLVHSKDTTEKGFFAGGRYQIGLTFGKLQLDNNLGISMNVLDAQTILSQVLGDLSQKLKTHFKSREAALSGVCNHVVEYLQLENFEHVDVGVSLCPSVKMEMQTSEAGTSRVTTLSIPLQKKVLQVQIKGVSGLSVDQISRISLESLNSEKETLFDKLSDISESLTFFGLDVKVRIQDEITFLERSSLGERPVVMLDIDNTVYDSSSGIEQQIVKRIHQWAKHTLDMSKEQADTLHKTYGSTIAGVLECYPGKRNEYLEKYKESVFCDIDFSELKCAREGIELNVLLSLLEEVWVVSNSPRKHIKRVLESLGVGIDMFANIFALDTLCKNEDTFWDQIIPCALPNERQCILIDDSSRTIESCSCLGITGLEIGQSWSLLEAILYSLKLIPPRSYFQFDMVQYIQHKNVQDNLGRSGEVWNEFQDEVTSTPKKEIIHVLDLGAGLLNMLQLFCSEDFGFNEVHYWAVENDSSLYQKWESIVQSIKSCDHVIFHGITQDIFEFSRPAGITFDIVFAECLLDMFDPSELVERLQMIAPNALLYAPHTYNGSTRFAGGDHCYDETFEQLYNKYLETTGGCVQAEKFLVENERRGGYTVMSEDSFWSPESLTYFWNCLMFQYSHSINMCQDIDSAEDLHEFFRKIYKQPSSITVSNLDILCYLPPLYRVSTFVANFASFEAPWRVEVKEEVLSVGPDDVLVWSFYSLISAGTELKVVGGNVSETDFIDPSFGEQKFSCPFRYGYSLVGEIVNVGKNVDSNLIGRNVFLFREHCSAVITSESSLLYIPSSVSVQDAMYFGMMETAVHVVQCIRPVLGSTVLVVGQGVVGLFIVGILSTMGIDVDVSEINPERRKFSNEWGATNIFEKIPQERKYDVCVEASGNPTQISSCIEHTSKEGNVILVSFYGNGPCSLNLGLSFHRKNITISTVQVSQIPSSLSGLWTKERRYKLVWRMLEVLKPSHHLDIMEYPLVEIEKAYKSLKDGKTTSARIFY